jgi:hypothetical protein
LVIDDRDAVVDDDYVSRLAEKIGRDSGQFSSPKPVVRANDLILPEQVVEARDLVAISNPDAPGRALALERGVVGAEWTRFRHESLKTRITLYGFKGGVGRSTATFMLAYHLAQLGKCVLVVDLDLESPGIGSLLQDPGDLPDFGIVDYLVESAVDNSAGLEIVARARVAPDSGNGEVWIAPAGGRPRNGYGYLPKLNRVYADITSADGAADLSFSGRLAAGVEACEHQVAVSSRQPDVVLLDSRAGIHDLAAVAITQLGDVSLLFAQNSQPTWIGYHSLFSQWRDNPEWAVEARSRLKMVAAMVPGLNKEQHLADFLDRAQACFAETLYDDTSGGDIEGYNPGLEDTSAPHFPLPVLFSNDLVGLDTSHGGDWYRTEFVSAAFQDFLNGMDAVIADLEEVPGGSGPS